MPTRPGLVHIESRSLPRSGLVRSAHATTPATKSVDSTMSSIQCASSMDWCACTRTVLDTPTRSRSGAMSSGM